MTCPVALAIFYLVDIKTSKQKAKQTTKTELNMEYSKRRKKRFAMTHEILKAELVRIEKNTNG